ncbi:hypothetical protein DKT75_20985 [Leucothrix arctica]|uniref:Uncharacterized protein n=2 Tax=Leucothrix arctica TaxID=1481894 RepID=A0A317C385_9GAMM|nr:hypothetical protein DKT75_20985 [Leucothrix arctica]
MCLNNAAADIRNKNEEWLELAQSLDADIPQTRIIQMLHNEPSPSDEELKDEDIKQEIDLLTNRKDRLQGLVDLSQHLVSEIDEKLAKLQVQTSPEE